MDLSKPPDDTELRNIIDKLAQFVARNGPEFEMMTKTKQKDNPKFQFLFGGEYFNYYQYKVTTEQAIFKQQQQQGGISLLDQQQSTTELNCWNILTAVPTPLPQPPPQPQVNYTAEIEQISQQQDVLREQIKQSEQNLNAQHTVLLQQQQTAVDAAVAKCESEELQRRVEDCGLILAEMHSVLQPIIDTCTKDSISHGKSWFLQRADSKEKAQSIVQCFLLKALRSATFPQKLHIIYLVNDLLHHSGRKHATDFKDALEIGVIPMFCNASIAATTEQHQKLDKLLKLWESKANYLKSETLEKLRKPVQSYQEYQSEQNKKYAAQVLVLSDQTSKTFDGYQAQHQAFVCHAMQQIMDLQQQKQNLEAQQKAQQKDPHQQQNLESLQASLQQTIQSLSQTNSNSMPPATVPPIVHQTFPIQQVMASQQQQQSSNDSYLQMNPGLPPPLPPDISPLPSNGVDTQPQFTQPPPGYLPPPGMFPDFSKPPPGFPPKPEVFLEELVPSAPYYDLPAGLMVPLVRLEDSEYKPLDPRDIRLPPPAPPSERLLAAVDAFYSLPSHERPRDAEGWEKLGLYEYYKAKNAAKREKEAAIVAGLRTKSRTPSPIILKQEKENTPPKRRYRSKSPTPPPETHTYNRSSSRRSRSRSRGRDRDRSRSRSRSPRRRRGTRESRDSRENRRRRSFSRSRSRSPRRSRSRSISPTGMMGAGLGSMPFSRGIDQELDSSNKGHQLLQKMGWGGRGLGAHEQGIDTPISGGDVRDRQDQFKGVGCNLNDPYENFRKNKGAAFITRMKARAEERDKDKDKDKDKEKDSKVAKSDY